MKVTEVPLHGGTKTTTRTTSKNNSNKNNTCSSSSSGGIKPMQVKRFNRYDALISEYYRLQQSKINFLLNGNQEVVFDETDTIFVSCFLFVLFCLFRLLIQFLSQNDASNTGHASQIALKIDSFKTSNSINNTNNNIDDLISNCHLANKDIDYIENEVDRLRE